MILNQNVIQMGRDPRGPWSSATVGLYSNGCWILFWNFNYYPSHHYRKIYFQQQILVQLIYLLVQRTVKNILWYKHCFVRWLVSGTRLATCHIDHSSLTGPAGWPPFLSSCLCQVDIGNVAGNCEDNVATEMWLKKLNCILRMTMKASERDRCKDRENKDTHLWGRGQGQLEILKCNRW